MNVSRTVDFLEATRLFIAANNLSNKDGFSISYDSDLNEIIFLNTSANAARVQ